MEYFYQTKGEATQQRVYDFIVDFITSKGYSPSMREISTGTGIKSTASVSDYLCMLEKLGKIKTENNKVRTISLVGYKLVKIDD